MVGYPQIKRARSSACLWLDSELIFDWGTASQITLAYGFDLTLTTIVLV